MIQAMKSLRKQSMKSLNKILFLACLTSIQSCVVVRTTDHHLSHSHSIQLKVKCDAGFHETHSGELVHWPSSKNMNLVTHPEFPDSFMGVIESSLNKYNATFSTLELSIEKDSSLKSFEGKILVDGKNALYWVEEEYWIWNESNPDAVAMTVSQVSGTEIVESDIFIRASVFGNDEKATIADYDIKDSNENYSEHSLYMVAVHEAGHALGRCHSEEFESIMWPNTPMSDEELRMSPFSKSDLEIFSGVFKLKNPEENQIDN